MDAMMLQISYQQLLLLLLYPPSFDIYLAQWREVVWGGCELINSPMSKNTQLLFVYNIYWKNMTPWYNL